MENTDLFEKVCKVIATYVRSGNNSQELTKETRLLEDLRINSARMVDIILELEDQFLISIDDDAADRIKTVGDAIDVVDSKLQSVGAGNS
jgi:acyl carrier protein